MERRRASDQTKVPVVHVAVVGQGSLGSAISVWFAKAGNRVTAVERNQKRRLSILNGHAVSNEPLLNELMIKFMNESSIDLIDTYKNVDQVPDMVAIAVDTPALPWGQADVSRVESVMNDIVDGPTLPELIVTYSTIPPGTSQLLIDAHPEMEKRYCHIPSFTSEGSALSDLDFPYRLVVGTFSEEPLALLIEGLSSVVGPWHITDPASAELIKYMSNCAIAAKLSFANEIADLCDVAGASIDDVLVGIARDPRIGPSFLSPGIGFGDSCLPKDTRALKYWAQSMGTEPVSVDATIEINERQKIKVARMLTEITGSHAAQRLETIAVLGVRNEPSAPNLQYSPSNWVIPQLMLRCDNLVVWDAQTSSEEITDCFPGVKTAGSVLKASVDADVIVILTEWPELLQLDWQQIVDGMTNNRAVLDPKNFLPMTTVLRTNMRYIGSGRRYGF